LRLKYILSLALAAVSGITLALAFLLAYFVLRYDRIELADEALLVRAKAAALLPPERIPLLEPRLVVLYDAHGLPSAFTRNFGPEPPPWESMRIEDPVEEGEDGFDLEWQDKKFRAVVVPSSSGGWLLYARTSELLEKDLSTLGQVFGFTILGALLLTVLVARLVGGRLARDVDAIAGVARAMSTGDLSARLAESRSGAWEIQRLRRDLNHMIEELSALLTAQRTFVSHAAHEIRSPLTTLQTELELALRRERTVANYQEVLRRSLDEVQQLGALAEDLLLLAHTQWQRAQEQDTALHAVLTEALRMAAGRIEQRGIAVRVDAGDAGTMRIRGRTRDLARALRNLVDNAVDHAPPGSEVRVGAARAGDLVRIAVEDSGKGVPPGDAPNVFSPFYRGADAQASERPGGGLGLSIAREIARAAGGDVILDETYRSGPRPSRSWTSEGRRRGGAKGPRLQGRGGRKAAAASSSPSPCQAGASTPTSHSCAGRARLPRAPRRRVLRPPSGAASRTPGRPAAGRWLRRAEPPRAGPRAAGLRPRSTETSGPRRPCGVRRGESAAPWGGSSASRAGGR
jgi:two-component system OmpR family sensor kinase